MGFIGMGKQNNGLLNFQAKEFKLLLSVTLIPIAEKMQKKLLTKNIKFRLSGIRRHREITEDKNIDAVCSNSRSLAQRDNNICTKKWERCLL